MAAVVAILVPTSSAARNPSGLAADAHRLHDHRDPAQTPRSHDRGASGTLARRLQQRSIIMSSTTAAELEDLLGDVNPLMIERILATQATTAEVAEALADAEDERRFGERRVPASARVAEVREILEELLDDREEDDAVTYGAPA